MGLRILYIQLRLTRIACFHTSEEEPTEFIILHCSKGCILVFSDASLECELEDQDPFPQTL